MNAPNKRAYILHGWGGNPKEGWFPWLAEELRKKGFDVTVLSMPNSEGPRIEEWVGHLREVAPYPDMQTYFIGHSIGCQTILRYLEALPDRVRIGGAIFVAGWTTLNLGSNEEKIIARPWIEKAIDFDKAKKHSPHFLALFSDNDSVVPRENEQVFKKRLGAEVLREKKRGHFSGSDGVMQIPVVLERLITWSHLPYGA